MDEGGEHGMVCVLIDNGYGRVASMNLMRHDAIAVT